MGGQEGKGRLRARGMEKTGQDWCLDLCGAGAPLLLVLGQAGDGLLCSDSLSSMAPGDEPRRLILQLLLPPLTVQGEAAVRVMLIDTGEEVGSPLYPPHILYFSRSSCPVSLPLAGLDRKPDSRG